MKRWWESEQQAGNVAENRPEKAVPAPREQGDSATSNRVDTDQESAAPAESQPAGSPPDPGWVWVYVE